MYIYTSTYKVLSIELQKLWFLSDVNWGVLTTQRKRSQQNNMHFSPIPPHSHLHSDWCTSSSLSSTKPVAGLACLQQNNGGV